MTAPALSDVVATLDALYPQAWADPGDPVGLTIGDPARRVTRVLLAVDPVAEVAREAVATGASLLVTHHPLLFRGVHSVAANTPKGRVVHDLIRNDVALYSAHTNADHAPDGVSMALAAAFGLRDVRPLVPAASEPTDKLVTFVPVDHAGAVVDALAAAGAGQIGDYDRCAFLSSGTGTFRPGPDAHPTIGEPGAVAVVAETRIEMVMRRDRRTAVLTALRAAHPYEEPAFDIVEHAAWPTRRGLGCVGTVSPETTLRDFAAHVMSVLPDTAGGARLAGDPDSVVRTVGLVGGAGDSYLSTAFAAGVDVYVTSDLRHHPASEFREIEGAPALMDVAHWAAESIWLDVAASDIRAAFAAADYSCEVVVSRTRTDPWTAHVPSNARGGTP